MSILTDTSGEFVFVVKNGDKYEQVKFNDLKDIPKDFDYLHMIKFVGNIPPPPHTIQEHEQIALFREEFNKFMKRKR